MQVNSVSLNNFKGQRADGTLTREEALKAMCSLSDETIAKMAYVQTFDKKSQKRHKRISNAIMWSIPLAAGVAAAVRKPSVTNLKDLAALTKTKLPNLNISRFVRLKNFAATTLSWGGTFALIDLVFGAKNQLDKHSKTSRKFSENHPLLSMLGTVGVSIGALYGARFGALKLLGKKFPQGLRLAAKDIKDLKDVSVKLNNSKVLNKTSKLLDKVPSAIKEFSTGVLNWSPLLLVLTSIGHSAKYSRNKNAQYAKNYNDLKELQASALDALSNEEA